MFAPSTHGNDEKLRDMMFNYVVTAPSTATAKIFHPERCICALSTAAFSCSCTW